jgi:hypothetical protein
MLYPQSFAYVSSTASLKPSTVQSTGATEVFPASLFYLICASFSVSTAALIFGTLILSTSPLLWVFPPVFILTLLYHAVITFVSYGESSGSLRPFSRAGVIATYVLAGLWMGVSGVTVAVNILIQLKKLEASKGPWGAIVPCIFSFIEVIIVVVIAVLMQKERRRILYTDKWKWQAGHGASKSSQWRYAICRLSYISRLISLTVSLIDFLPCMRTRTGINFIHS